MKLIDSYNDYIQDYIENHINSLNPVLWIERNIVEMGSNVELSDIQRHIISAETSLLNRHIPRRRGKTFAVLCSAIHKACVLKQTCLYVAPNQLSTRYAKNKVIELLRASELLFIHATDYVRIGEGCIYFTHTDGIDNSYRGRRFDCVFLDEVTASPEVEAFLIDTPLITVGSSAYR